MNGGESRGKQVHHAGERVARAASPRRRALAAEGVRQTERQRAAEG